MSLEERFTDAQQRVNNLSKRPDNMELLELYALFKQGSMGDVSGKRPGRLDFKGRAKYDVWAAKKGMSTTDAMESYIATVDRLVARYG